MSTQNKWFPPPTMFSFPFYYASLSSLTLFWRVPIQPLRSYLKNTTLEPADFGTRGQGVVSLEFQNYTEYLGTGSAPSNAGMGTCNEVEFNILCFPKIWKEEGRVPDISFEDFIIGEEQTKTVGSYRVQVPADNLVAVKAGADEFGEQKFYTMFNYSVPAGNAPKQSSVLWDYTVLDPGYAIKLKNGEPAPPKTPPEGIIYTLTANLTGLVEAVGNPSPITLFSTIPATPPPCAAPNFSLVNDPKCWNRRRPTLPTDILLASNWNIRGDFLTYFPGKKKINAAIKLGKSQDPMRQALADLLPAGTAPAAARVYQTPPAATESRPYIVNVK